MLAYYNGVVWAGEVVIQPDKHEWARSKEFIVNVGGAKVRWFLLGLGMLLVASCDAHKVVPSGNSVNAVRPAPSGNSVNTVEAKFMSEPIDVKQKLCMNLNSVEKASLGSPSQYSGLLDGGGTCNAQYWLIGEGDDAGINFYENLPSIKYVFSHSHKYDYITQVVDFKGKKIIKFLGLYGDSDSDMNRYCQLYARIPEGMITASYVTANVTLSARELCKKTFTILGFLLDNHTQSDSSSPKVCVMPSDAWLAKNKYYLSESKYGCQDQDYLPEGIFADSSEAHNQHVSVQIIHDTPSENNRTTTFIDGHRVLVASNIVLGDASALVSVDISSDSYLFIDVNSTVSSEQEVRGMAIDLAHDEISHHFTTQ